MSKSIPPSPASSPRIQPLVLGADPFVPDNTPTSPTPLRMSGQVTPGFLNSDLYPLARPLSQEVLDLVDARISSMSAHRASLSLRAEEPFLTGSARALPMVEVPGWAMALSTARSLLSSPPAHPFREHASQRPETSQASPAAQLARLENVADTLQRLTSPSGRAEPLQACQQTVDQFIAQSATLRADLAATRGALGNPGAALTSEQRQAILEALDEMDQTLEILGFAQSDDNCR